MVGKLFKISLLWLLSLFWCEMQACYTISEIMNTNLSRITLHSCVGTGIFFTNYSDENICNSIVSIFVIVYSRTCDLFSYFPCIYSLVSTERKAIRICCMRKKYASKNKHQTELENQKQYSWSPMFSFWAFQTAAYHSMKLGRTFHQTIIISIRLMYFNAGNRPLKLYVQQIISIFWFSVSLLSQINVSLVCHLFKILSHNIKVLYWFTLMTLLS